MKIITKDKDIRKQHLRNLSYDDAATLEEVWILAKRFNRSFYREWRDHWDEHGYTST